jgi:mRNA interferase RelE/StbE
MAGYDLRFRKSVAKDLRALPKKDVARILKCFQLLAEDPRRPGCEKLTGQDRYRYRQGRYRIIYEIRDNELLIVVVKVGHRKDVHHEG